MLASQVDPQITNEDFFVVPYTAGSIKMAIESAHAEHYGAMSLHNNLGSNKSIMMPLVTDADYETLRVILNEHDHQAEYLEHIGSSLKIGGVREVNKAFDATMEDFTGNLFHRDFQVNILVPKQSEEFYSAQNDRKLGLMHYELLVGEPNIDVATFRAVINPRDYMQNAHIVEAVLSKTVLEMISVDMLDLSNHISKNLKWLGANYLSKNTIGNLFPQMMPAIEEQRREIEARVMRENNSHWGVLAGLTALRGN